MAPLRIRPIDESDIPAAAAALVQVYATDGYPVEGVADPESWISSPGVLTAYVAELDGRILGHVAVMSSQGADAARLWASRSPDDPSSIAVLARLFVVREARGQSAGRELVQAATAYARRRGLRLVLDVVTKDTAAIRLYERLGWRKFAEATHHYGAGERTSALCYVSPRPHDLRTKGPALGRKPPLPPSGGQVG